MTRSEFLGQLQQALQNDLSISAVKENVNYYNNYILDEVQNGKPESEVLATLGDPWMIARTIIQTQGGQDSSIVEEADQGSSEQRIQVRQIGLNTWWQKLLLLLSVILIIVVVFAIITGLISLLAPILIPIVVIMIIVRLINGGRR